METLVIGTGPMAVAYTNVLNALNIPFKVIGRSSTSAEAFKIETGITPWVGGLQNYLNNCNISKDTQAIIATGTESLMSSLILLLNAGVSKILVEKPGAISIEELIQNGDKINSYISEVYIAYNRRFYSTVLEAERLINEDGGLLSLHFEFTEWAHRITPLAKAVGVKENWFFANSSHVIDLAFYLAGRPAKWQAFSKQGSLSWHEITNFSGAGITEKGVLFSYLANWESAGRWAIELLTKNRRIYLKPLESIEIQKKGTIQVDVHQIDQELDHKFKPGLYNQVEAFIHGRSDKLVTFQDHLQSAINIYTPILNSRVENSEK